MTDYFALLDQPRAAWLDPTSLQDAYHKKSLQSHPDTAPGRDTDGNFAELNKAYQVLQDPKQRLHHLLGLEGHDPSGAGESIAQELQELFPRIGALAQQANSVLEKNKAASNPLSRSLLKPELLEVEKETSELRAKLQELFEAAVAQLRQISSDRAQNDGGRIASLSKLYLTFAYLTRWSAQLDEIAFQLSL